MLTNGEHERLERLLKLLAFQKNKGMRMMHPLPLVDIEWLCDKIDFLDSEVRTLKLEIDQLKGKA